MLLDLELTGQDYDRLGGVINTRKFMSCHVQSKKAARMIFDRFIENSGLPDVAPARLDDAGLENM